MNDKVAASVHWSFWVIGAIALIWNVMGAMNYFMQMDAEVLAGYPESHRAIVVGRPAWATGAFAVAVFGGAFGCLLLLLRKSAANYMFIASLLGAIITMIHAINVARVTISFTLNDIALTIVSPLVVAALLLWYSKLTERMGWIR